MFSLLSLPTGRIYQSLMDIHVYILSLPIDMKDMTIMFLMILHLILILIGYKIHSIPSPEEYGCNIFRTYWYAQCLEIISAELSFPAKNWNVINPTAMNSLTL